MKRVSALLLALIIMLLPAAVFAAAPITIYGTVVCTTPIAIVSTASGLVESLHADVGDHVSAGDAIATLTTQKVYAETDGTVCFFGVPGDKIEDIMKQYGAVAYLLPAHPYTITAKATNSNGETIRVIPGETVYLRCYQDGKHKGKGMVVRLNDGQYTVNVTEGEFDAGEIVSIYRDAEYKSASRIGRDKVEKAAAIEYSGDGYLVKAHVAFREQVAKGTLLYETISGTFSPEMPAANTVIAPADGTIAVIHQKNGNEIAAGSILAQLYPDASLRIAALAPESVLNDVAVGNLVDITCQYTETMSEPVEGIIEKISRIPEADTGSLEAQYAVYITIENAAPFYYGMNVAVTTK